LPTLPLNLFKKNNLNYFGDLFTTAETTRTTLLRLELPIPWITPFNLLNESCSIYNLRFFILKPINFSKRRRKKRGHFSPYLAPLVRTKNSYNILNTIYIRKSIDYWFEKYQTKAAPTNTTVHISLSFQLLI
jgi:hypothetical protein